MQHLHQDLTKTTAKCTSQVSKEIYSAIRIERNRTLNICIPKGHLLRVLDLNHHPHPNCTQPYYSSTAYHTLSTNSRSWRTSTNRMWSHNRASPWRWTRASAASSAFRSSSRAAAMASPSPSTRSATPSFVLRVEERRDSAVVWQGADVWSRRFGCIVDGLRE